MGSAASISLILRCLAERGLEGWPAQVRDEMSAHLYILRCRDGSYYVGTTRGQLEKRIAEHQAGAFDGYTAYRRPVVLVFQQHFERVADAVAAERQVKGWRREKKGALIRGDFASLPALSRRSTRRRAQIPSGDPDD
jgi:putative endonuclease